MIKNNEMKQILESWRNFSQQANTSVLSERVFMVAVKTM